MGDTMMTALGELKICETTDETDYEQIWEQLLMPTFRAGDTYCIPTNVSKEEAIAYWTAYPHRIFVADIIPEDGSPSSSDHVGTYFLTPNQQGSGAHISTCAFVTAPAARGKGIGRAMLKHAMLVATAEGYRGMQFNFVLCTNTSAIKLWKSEDFAEVGRLPGAFEHSSDGYVDALVMYRPLGVDDLAGFFRKVRLPPIVTSGGTALTLEEEAAQEEMDRMQKARKSANLPDAQCLPAPEPVPVVLDGNGYDINRTSPFDRFVYHLDSMLSKK